MSKISYASNQTSNRIYICVKMTFKQLELLQKVVIVNIFISDIGKNGYLIDFPINSITIGILTLINNGPIGEALN